MARYTICDKCREFIEYKPDIKYEGGITYEALKCPKCGHIKYTSTNHIHYGNDGKK